MIFTAIVGVVLALIEYLIFFRPNDYFFQGDTIWYFYLRHRSFPDFLLSFLKLDAAGWYRPLSSATIQSIFYPFFGLEPAGYRIVHYVLFMAAISAIYVLALQITKRRIAACIATLFFAVHSVNAFTTFDLLFTPEIGYSLFYICAVIAYLRPGGLPASVVLFVLSLLSKETAVTLPLMLVALDIVLNRKLLFSAISRIRVHLIVLGIYLALVIGYLGVQRPAFQSIFARPGPEVAYRFALDRTIVDNAGLALTWSFNIPRGWQNDSRSLRNWMMTFLQGFRAIALILGIWMLFRPERRIMLAGLAWFFVAVAPGLPLFEHFLPYYLFLPLVGFSIAIGITFDAAYRKLPAAGIAIVLIFSILTGVNAFGARNDARDNRVLGWSSRLALNSLNDLKAAHPALQPNTTIYISDAEEPNLSWDTSLGRLFKIAYADESINSLYWSWGEVITRGVVERGPVVVMRYRQFHLTDITQEFLAASVPPVSYRPPSGNTLEVMPAEARPGEKYRLSVSGLADADIVLHYTRDGGPVQEFAAHLDRDQQATFDVSASTDKGLYRFVGFRMPASDDWVQASASIQIK